MTSIWNVCLEIFELKRRLAVSGFRENHGSVIIQGVVSAIPLASKKTDSDFITCPFYDADLDTLIAKIRIIVINSEIDSCYVCYFIRCNDVDRSVSLGSAGQQEQRLVREREFE